jgi:hypothetical protein
MKMLSAGKANAKKPTTASDATTAKHKRGNHGMEWNGMESKKYHNS